MAKTHIIDGVTYVEDVNVIRNAAKGEYVIIAGVNGGDCYKDGDILKATVVGYRGQIFETEPKVLRGGVDVIFNREYRVLEPLESEEVTVDTTQASPQVIEMFAALSRKIVSLEQQLRDTQRNLQTFAEQTESNSEDIRTLDERTQSLVSKQPKVESPTITECYISMSHDDITNLDVSFVGKPSVDELVKVFTQVLDRGGRR